MFKIKYLPTGNTFNLPDKIALELKDNDPDSYQIVEKNGRKFKDKCKLKRNVGDEKSILSKVLDNKG